MKGEITYCNSAISDISTFSLVAPALDMVAILQSVLIPSQIA